MSNAGILESFPNPGPAYRGKPFWCWNGNLNDAELLRQMHVFQEMGFGGFFMHSRTGLITDYLGEEWFRLTNLCADEAAKLGMEAWLYDEDRWPSGTAGGMVTASPAYRQRFISLHQVTPDAFRWDDQIFAAFAANVDGLNLSHCRRLRDRQTVDERDKTILVFRIEQAAESSFYNGKTYVDTMNRAATDAFIRMTHDRYLEKCGGRIGTSIRGIFTDEPHRGPVMNGFSLSNANRLWMTPWTQTLPEDFKAAFGYDIVEHLPELFFQPGGEPVAAVKWQYMELLQRLLLSNFAKPLFDWCSQHRIQLTGHVLHEDSLTAQACMHGSLMRFYEFMHLPGIDILAEGNRCYWVAKQLTSVARQLGQMWRISELYGCTGWQMDFAGHKAVGDWQAVLGINVRCQHLAWYTMEGEAKRDYPASISQQSAWWKDYRHVEDYFSRLGVLLSHGQPCCGTLVISPVESVWCQIHGAWAESLAPKDDAIKQLESAYAELFTWLTGAQVEFDYGDEEMMSRLAKVGRDLTGKPVIHFGQAEYRTVIIGAMTTIRSSTLQLIEAFADAGGSVIVAGPLPAYVDAIRSATAEKSTRLATCVAWDRDALVQACLNQSDPRVSLSAPVGSGTSQIFSHLRRDESGDLVVVLLNTNREQGVSDVAVQVVGASTHSEVAEWDCESGARFSTPALSAKDGSVGWSIDLPAGGLRSFVVGASAADGLAARPNFRVVRRWPIEQSFRYSLTEPNVCVLDMARVSIDSGEWQPRMEILKVDRAVRSALGLKWRSGEMVQPWLRRRTVPCRQALRRIRLDFDFSLKQMIFGPIELALEQPQFFTIHVNGHLLDKARNSIPGQWIDNAFHRFGIPRAFLRAGENHIQLEADFHEDVNLEAIYVLGDFGVSVRGSTAEIVPLPARLRTGDLTTQGLAFYGGGIRYHIDVPETSGHRVQLELPELKAACAKVVAEGKPPAMLAWHPYRAEVTDLIQHQQLVLEVTLTRRNTFGPLHQLPLLTPHYGPDNFTTHGEHWSDDYVLFPSGLLAAPVLVEVSAD
jgi:hypothetical protein